MDPIQILYQDENLIAVEKPSGMLVHPYKKETNEKDHLMRWVKQQTGHYLYPIHRLDRPVSGIVLFGLNSEIVRLVKAIWHDAETTKEYLALAKGQIEVAGSYSFSLLNERKQKQSAETHYEPLEIFNQSTLLCVRLSTGRKHQIRRHFSRRCANIIGDTKYGQGKINRFFKDEFGLDRIFLHATSLKFNSPLTGRPIEINSPLPEPLIAALNRLRERNDRI